MDIKQLREMVEEAVSAFLDEFNYNDRMAALKASRPAGGAPEQIKLDGLMGKLFAMQKAGKQTIARNELESMMKDLVLPPSSPLGVGKMSDLRGVTKAAVAASGPTGGAPLVKPPASLYAREGKVRMTEADLKEMVSRVVAAKLAENGVGGIGMGNPIMAKREIIALMDQTSRSFEQEIIKTFKLQNPDVLSPELQRSYLEIVEGMKAKMVQAAMEAVQSLVKFPKIDEGNGGMK